jgi:hypothetical protein
MSRREQPDGGAGGGGGGWVVVDSGLKAQSVDSGPGVVVTTAHEFASAGRPAWVEEEAAAAAPGGGGDDTAGAATGSTSGGGFFASSVGRLYVAGVSDEHSTLKPRLPAAAAGSEPAAGAGADGPAVVLSPLSPPLVPLSSLQPCLPALGTSLLLIPGHCDPTVNHFDHAVVLAVTGRSPGI